MGDFNSNDDLSFDNGENSYNDLNGDCLHNSSLFHKTSSNEFKQTYFDSFQKVFPGDTKNTSKVEENKQIVQKEEPKVIPTEVKQFNKFKVIKYVPQKRGKKTNSPKKLKPHTRSYSDNILTKIMVHMFKFAENLANDAKDSCNKKLNNFYKIDYKYKKLKEKDRIKQLIEKDEENKYIYKYKNIFHNIISIKNKGIKKIVKNKIELKEKKITNRINYENICENYPILEEFFNQGFMEVIDQYYLLDKKKYNNIINYKNLLNIKLSSKTETFWELLERKENKPDKGKYKKIFEDKFKLSISLK